ncbi:MAG: cytochrome b N-terminal domain-containing protein [Vampirovibrionales bacterium]|nr:cytochrome b N-terminal domain-containing protein [Vampirovibrionales bacterium]
MTTIMQAVMSLLLSGWKFILERVGKIDLFDETKSDQRKSSPWYMLGGIYYLAWVLVMTSGLILVAFYIPTTAQAFDSINAIMANVPFGSIIRGFHKYGADCMIIAATLRIYRMWFAGEYKNKGELTFILALVLLLVAMYSGLTGYLLIWNQRAFWATKVFATFPTYLDITPGRWHWPWETVAGRDLTWFLPNIIGATTKIIGNLTHQGVTTSQILMGGASIGQATMTRFFSLHFGISLILLVISELYFYQNRMKRINLSRWAVFGVIAMLLITSIIFPTESGSRANPEVTPLPILSDWYFLALYQMLKYMDPYWATIWTVGIPVITIGLTFLDFGKETNIWRRPMFFCMALMGFIQFVIFSLLIIANQANLDRDPPYWYGSMVFFITIGQFWHWALYKQLLPMAIWVGFNLVISIWYLLHWHVISADWLLLWFSAQGQVDWNATNLYWNLLWLAYAFLQAAVAGVLILPQLPRYIKNPKLAVSELMAG